MLEAVGEHYWHAYFKTLRERLRPGGTAVLQVITIDERRFAGYRNSPDFIQRYIFPGGMLPTKTIIEAEAARAGLALVSVETFGDSYALTLAEWRRRFLAAWPAVEALGFGPPFRRLWEYYLCYSEAGFRTGTIDVGLYALCTAGDEAAARGNGTSTFGVTRRFVSADQATFVPNGGKPLPGWAGLTRFGANAIFL